MSCYFQRLDELRARMHARGERAVQFARWDGAVWRLCDTAPPPGTLGLVIGPRQELQELLRTKSRLRVDCIFAYLD